MAAEVEGPRDLVRLVSFSPSVAEGVVLIRPEAGEPALGWLSITQRNAVWAHRGQGPPTLAPFDTLRRTSDGTSIVFRGSDDDEAVVIDVNPNDEDVLAAIRLAIPPMEDA